jgi:TolB-like protein/DNA-binding winged helix-turn-helix (wHTH) protein
VVNRELLEIAPLDCFVAGPMLYSAPKTVPAAVPAPVIRFDEFVLDCARYQLLRAGRRIKLEKLPMELLLLLVEKDGHLVTRQEIVDRLWGSDVFLDTEHGINTAVRKIRQVLRDDPEQPRFVQTVTGKGYRFIAPTITLPAEASTDPASTGIALDDAPPGEPGNKSADVVIPIAPTLEPSRRGSVLRKSTFVLLAIAALVVGMNLRGVSPAGRPRIHSLAVLPLENLSADPAQDYFADGMTDELITMLAKNAELRVISRTSIMQYRKVHRPLPEVARELGVDGILEGSVERFGSRVHINAQLIYAPQDMHLWAESYDRDLSDLTSLQSELAQTIAQQVGVTATASSLPAKRISPEAHDAYLMGRYYWFAEDYDKSRQYFQKAIDLQADYAAAWSGLADYYIASAVTGEIPAEGAIAKGEPAARKAVALDDSLAEAHNTMAAVYYFLHWDWNHAERESSHAVELNPRLAEARHLRGYILSTVRRTDDALQEDRKSMELDPFARPWALGLALYHARQVDAALSEARARSEAQPGDAMLHSLLCEIYLHKGMAPESVREWELLLDKQSAQELEQAFRRGGIRAAFEWRLARLKEASAKRYMSPLPFAHTYARLGRKDETIRFLERAYTEHTPWLVHIQNEPDFDFVHSDPRYQSIVARMGLPAVQ